MCSYSAPNINHSDFLEAIENLMQNITHDNKTSFIGGDLNVNLLNFGSVNQVNHFVDLMISNKMIPTISKPTRVTGESETLIDNILPGTWSWMKRKLTMDAVWCELRCTKSKWKTDVILSNE